MDVYADGLVSGLSAVRPSWEILQLRPQTRTHPKGQKLFRKLNRYYEQYWHYPQQIKRQAVDIFHIIDHSDGHIARWLKPLPIPTVVTCHDLINLRQPENAKHQAFLPALSSALWRYAVNGLRQADRLVTVSAHTAQDVNQLLDISPQQLTVVHNAADPEFQRICKGEALSVLQEHHIPSDRFYLLNVGSSQPRKNIEAILKVLAKLTAQPSEATTPSPHLIKAGAAFTAAQQTLIDSHNLHSYVTHIDKPDQATLIKLYNAADVLLAPSLYEGFGITILEAMACGTPVITSNVSSLPEVAGNAAILIEPTQLDQIANAVRSLQQDPAQRQALIEKGLRHAQSFTWEKSAEQVAQLYETLTASPRTQP
ncbi:MAG: glycosyltransferase family 1 protein [Cyanobacteria bacterium J06606_4]